MPENYWGIPPDVAWTGDADRVVVLRLSGDGETPQAMEGPAAAIWRVIARGPVTVGEIADRLAEEYEAEPDSLRADVSSFVAQLAQRYFVAPTERIAG
ncbi:hypothetical protein LK09_03155 [Microbacterium mangrovi]|uniref:Pyrroloquinoline quinone biosynthesis protein PqqD n=1 Tax=Microbacterium mangrovi TaxID=1348253 RepID=A0A0B2ACF6_9MICO|nr:PqqD family protein [Microbacterium mangrovi]KHK99301.1 hypothetical protein LK09_03155 [Microbacterium mangrovi]